MYANDAVPVTRGGLTQRASSDVIRAACGGCAPIVFAPALVRYQCKTCRQLSWIDATLTAVSALLSAALASSSVRYCRKDAQSLVGIEAGIRSTLESMTVSPLRQAASEEGSVTLLILDRRSPNVVGPYNVKTRRARSRAKDCRSVVSSLRRASGGCRCGVVRIRSPDRVAVDMRNAKDGSM